MDELKGSAATRAKNKYNAQNYDSLRITAPKGRKAELQAHASQHGESLNKFVNRAIDNQVKQDNEKDAD